MENQTTIETFEVQDEETGMLFSVSPETLEDGSFIHFNIADEYSVYLELKEVLSLKEKLNSWIDNQDTLAFEVSDNTEGMMLSISDEHTEEGSFAHVELDDQYSILLPTDHVCELYDLLNDWCTSQQSESLELTQLAS